MEGIKAGDDPAGVVANAGGELVEGDELGELLAGSEDLAVGDAHIGASCGRDPAAGLDREKLQDSPHEGGVVRVRVERHNGAAGTQQRDGLAAGDLAGGADDPKADLAEAVLLGFARIGRPIADGLLGRDLDEDSRRGVPVAAGR